MSQLDKVFGIHSDALAVQRRRMEVLAANIANADTPGFLARDVDFSAVLAQKLDRAEGPRLEASSAGHIGGGESPQGADPLYRVPMQPSADGNTVDTQIEQAAYADAALHYQASLNFIDGRLKSLMTAITGQ